PVASDSFTQGVTITADEIEVDATSRIDVSGKGLLPSAAVGNYCGGSHGGLGGTYGGCGTNAVYGDYLAPVAFGMGGRYSGASNPNRGGGALKLVARSLKLDGQLLANGATNSINTTVGGGAGGSLWVDTQVLLGSVTTRIQANGGNGLHSGGPGGGGRVAIYYAGLQGIDVLSQFSVAAGAKTGNATAGQPGSLHLENRVVSTAVAGSNLLAWTNQALASFSIDFINAVEPASVSAETVRLTGPNGTVAITGISAVNTVRYQVNLAEALADGAYELRVSGIRSAQGRGMDQNGNGIEDEVDDVFVRTFVVDRSPPTAPVITSPLVTPAINSLNVRKVTISGERDAQTAVLVNGVQQVVLGDGPWTISNYSLAEGTSELQIQSRDVAGNLSPVSVLKFSVDSVHPSFQQYSHTGSIKEVPTSVWVRFNEVGSGLDFASSSLTLKRGTDSISGQLSLDGDVLRLTPNSTLLEGAYSVAVVLKDKAGNQSTTTYSFTLDYTAPLAPVVNAYPALTTNKQLLISGAKEPYSKVYIRNSANVQLAALGGSSSTTWQYTLVLEPGDNQFTVTQTDAAGNVSPATAVQV
ncbi:Ig-like domain-containing protein, partial [Pseudomonas anguilliseptica]|uniref:Ig-like domain-containing protein n=1 Tax=Pseudomonas anguilliseptica TaxID=53406 RepID=UPI003735C84F